MMQFPFLVKIIVSLFFVSIIQFPFLIQSTENSSLEKNTTYVCGVIDRIIHEKVALIIIEEHNKQISLRVHELPEGSREGTWLTIQSSAEGYIVLHIDDELTEHKSHLNERLHEQVKQKKITD